MRGAASDECGLTRFGLLGTARHDELPDEQLNDLAVLIARLDANGDDAAVRQERDGTISTTSLWTRNGDSACRERWQQFPGAGAEEC